MNTAEILRAARALIENPESWIQGDYSKNRCGEMVDPYDDSACKFCSVGAVSRVLRIHGDEAEEHEIIHLMNDLSGEGDVISFNDNHSHDDVLRLFSIAIEAAEAVE